MTELNNSYSQGIEQPKEKKKHPRLRRLWEKTKQVLERGFGAHAPEEVRREGVLSSWPPENRFRNKR